MMPRSPRWNRQSNESVGGGGAAETGVQANLGQSIAENSPGQSNTMEDSKVENFEPKLSQTETVEQSPFAVKKVTAAVGIPRSFIAGVFKLSYPDKSEPKDDDPEFISLRDEQVKRVRASVERIVMAKNTDDVEVAVYPDVEWNAEGGSWSRQPGSLPVVQAAAEGFDTLGLLRLYGPQAGLGLLALTVCFVTRLANRASAVSCEHLSDRDIGEPTVKPFLAWGRQP
jgi:hypothetical protein